VRAAAPTLDTSSSAIAPSRRRHGIDLTCARPPETEQQLSSPAASEFFFDQILQGIVLHGQISVHTLELRELGFGLLQALQIRGLHPSVSGLPIIKSGIADPVAAADLLHLGAGIGLFKAGYNLVFRESALLYRCFLAGLSCQKTTTSSCVISGGAYEDTLPKNEMQISFMGSTPFPVSQEQSTLTE